MHFLDILALHQVHATWFPEGSEALQGPEHILHVQAYGDEIGNHAMHHPHVMTLSDDAVCQEILEAEQALASITGQTTRAYFRPLWRGGYADPAMSGPAGLSYGVLVH